MDEKYAKHWLSGSQKRTAQQDADLSWLISQTELGQSSLVLDYGSGDGSFSQKLVSRTGAKVHFREPSTLLSKLSKSKGLIRAPMEVSAGYDLIILRGVLQYLDNPSQTIIALSKQLNSNSGRIAILMTPNSDSWQFRLHGTMPILAGETEWIRSVPSRRYIERLLIGLGFTVVEQPPLVHYLTSPYSKPLTDLISFAGNLFKRRVTGSDLRPWAGNTFNLIAFKKRAADID